MIEHILRSILPDKFLGFFPMYGEIPIPYCTLGVGELYNLGFLVVIIFVIFQHYKNQKYYKNGLIKKYACYLFSGKTGNGKTRLLTQIARDCKGPLTIVIQNYYSGYGDLFYSSFKDFCLIQADVAMLGEQINLEPEDKKIILKFFPNYFSDISAEDNKIIKKLKGKYDFITLGDEFYAYLHNRSFMQNFSKELGKKLLLDLHQTRHSKQTLLLASQDSDNLDLDLRQLAHNEIEVKSWLLELFYGFNIYSYLTKKEQKEVGKEFKKNNIIPYFFFNFYLVNQFCTNWKYLYWKYLYGIFCKLRKKVPAEFKKSKFLSKYLLDFNTRFSVKINIDTYNQGDLFRFLENREKQLKK